MFLTVPKRFARPLLLPLALAGALAVGCSRPADGSIPPHGGAVIEAVCAVPASGAVRLVREQTAVLTYREFVYPATSDSPLYGASLPGFIPSTFGVGLDPDRSPVEGNVDCGCR